MLTKKILLAALPFATLVGCGGDDGPKVMITPDAPMMQMIDAAPQPLCSVYNDTTHDLGSLTLGTDDQPAVSGDPSTPADWFEEIEEGDMMGQTELFIFARLPGADDNDATTDLMAIEVVKPGNGGGFPLGTAQNFVTDINAGTYAAATYIYGDVNGQQATNFYFANSGAVTLTEADEALNGLTKGTVGATAYTEYDDQGPVATGCMPSLTELSFVLKQQTATATGKSGGIPSERLQAFKDRIHQFKMQRAAH